MTDDRTTRPLAELTLRGIILGGLITLLFTAANVYLGLKVGLTFAKQLRAILRQDPDVVLVGEVRDGETSETAIRAALTGHMVLSTLHCNDAPSAVPRLLDMGIDPFMLSTSLIGAMSQRLVRQLCPACSSQGTLSSAEEAIFRAYGLAAPPRVRPAPPLTLDDHEGMVDTRAFAALFTFTSRDNTRSRL